MGLTAPHQLITGPTGALTAVLLPLGHLGSVGRLTREEPQEAAGGEVLGRMRSRGECAPTFLAQTFKEEKKNLSF